MKLTTLGRTRMVIENYSNFVCEFEFLSGCYLLGLKNVVFKHLGRSHMDVPLAGIEPASRVPQTRILSIELQEHIHYQR